MIRYYHSEDPISYTHSPSLALPTSFNNNNNNNNNINDMCNSSGSFKFINFADDTTVFKKIRIKILCAVANHEPSKVDAWLISN